MLFGLEVLALSGGTGAAASSPAVVHSTISALDRVALLEERVEVLELLAMTLAHLNDAEAGAEVSPRVPMLMAVRDKLATALREDL